MKVNEYKILTFMACQWFQREGKAVTVIGTAIVTVPATIAQDPSTCT